MEKSCKHCGHKLVGRSDKKFCDNGCRYTYHNLLNGEHNNAGRRLLYAARKNLRILQDFVSSGTRQVSSRQLRMAGFNFSAVTGIEDQGNNRIIRVFEMAIEEKSGNYRISCTE
jgi:hypothetical protein